MVLAGRKEQATSTTTTTTNDNDNTTIIMPFCTFSSSSSRFRRLPLSSSSSSPRKVWSSSSSPRTVLSPSPSSFWKSSLAVFGLGLCLGAGLASHHHHWWWWWWGSHHNDNHRYDYHHYDINQDNHVRSLDQVHQQPTTRLSSSSSSLSPAEYFDHDHYDGWRTIHVYHGRPDALLVEEEQEEHHHVTSNATLVSSSSSQSQQQPSQQNYQQQQHLHPWFSQARQDQLVIALLGGKRHGYFIDLAANDAQLFSNTYALERYYQWHGVCIEPNPLYWYNLSRYRSCQVVGAVVGGGEQQQQQQPSDKGRSNHTNHPHTTAQVARKQQQSQRVHFRFDAGDHGGIAGEGFNNGKRWQASSQQVYAVPLHDVFVRHHVPHTIDYLSLDVEGAESFIMLHFPLHLYRITIITAERLRGPIRAFLKQHGYQFIQKLTRWGESLWIHESALQGNPPLINRSVLHDFAFPL